MIAPDTVHHADLFDLCAQLDAGSVDMILADLPYGTTACSWDTVIPFEPMWTAFKRIIKPRGAIVLTASQPFTSALVMSWPQGFRHEWVWHKEQGTNPYAAEIAPMKIHETVLVFADGQVNYTPIITKGRPFKAFFSEKAKIGEVYGRNASVHKANIGTRFPLSVIAVNTENGLHPTQKPVALFEYLIRTYTQPGELVFDPTAGSGTTAVAARNTGRHYIVGDSSAEYVDVMRARLAKPYTLPMLELEDNA